MPSPVLLIGASGRLGSAFLRLWNQEGRAYLAPTSQEVNLLDHASLLRYVAEQRPSAVVMTAAHTAVDLAENDERALAYALNAQAPETLALACASFGIPLVFLSTDYVFAGTQERYHEHDLPSPINVYGASKAEGERRCFMHHPKQTYVIRTARLFGPAGSSQRAKKSFLELILADAEKSAVVHVNPEERGVPTHVDDLAKHVTQHFLNETRPAGGIYHLTNGGAAVTWLEWAQSLKEMYDLPVQLVARNPATLLGRAAKRPPQLQLQNTKLPPMRPWQEAQAEFLAQKPYPFSPVWPQ